MAGVEGGGMNKKKIVSLVLTVTMIVCTLIGCGKSENADSAAPTTIAGKLEVQFVAEIAQDSDIESVANKLTTNECLQDVSMIVMPMEPGFLNGFNEDVTGFDSAVIFCPMIGTIPFVGYIFETGDTNALEEELKAKATLNWNICTQADEMVIHTEGDKVLFVMAPNSFE